MSPERKEEFRWQFAGQAMAATLGHHERFPDPDEINLGMAECVTCADALIAELEKTMPECMHDFRAVKYNDHGLTKCTKCGLQR